MKNPLRSLLPAGLYPAREPPGVLDGPFTVVNVGTNDPLDVGFRLEVSLDADDDDDQRPMRYRWWAAERAHYLPDGTLDVDGDTVVFTPDDPAKTTLRFRPVVAADADLLFPSPPAPTDGALVARLRRLWGLTR